MSKLNHHHAAGLLVFFLLITTTRAQQSPPTDDNNNYFNTGSFNPSVAILIVVLISAFFFLGFFSIYIRNCGAASSNGGNGTSIRGALTNAMARSRRQRGLEPAVLETFPTMIYSEVKEHKIGKGSLECAVCLSEFEDDENLRLLPKCDHVFHTDCIDAWLASHVTCPVCRCNLTPDPNQLSNETQPQEGNSSGAADHQALIIDVQDSTTDQERNTINQEAVELERIGSQRRAIRAKSVRRPANFTRSHSTGHSIIASVNKDKYTLKLPENIRKEIIASGQLKRSRSLQVSFPSKGEASSRNGFRFGSGEGSNRGARSIRLGRSGRWPSFILRNFSARTPARSPKIKPDAEGSNSSQV
ncbi:hypothetical protein LUZ60_001219 [Juncus effusus]|nr:hypothetical protein LUZ60_001219 [Juncus effusus]